MDGWVRFEGQRAEACVGRALSWDERMGGGWTRVAHSDGRSAVAGASLRSAWEALRWLRGQGLSGRLATVEVVGDGEVSGYLEGVALYHFLRTGRIDPGMAGCHVEGLTWAMAA